MVTSTIMVERMERNVMGDVRNAGRDEADEQRRLMGEAASRKVAERFTLSHMARVYEQVCHSILHRYPERRVTHALQ